MNYITLILLAGGEKHQQFTGMGCVTFFHCFRWLHHVLRPFLTRAFILATWSSPSPWTESGELTPSDGTIAKRSPTPDMLGR
jgi:hypothetical protein